MNKWIIELIGTFFLVLTIGLTVITPGAGPMAPLAIGSALMVVIFAGGHISGAHYNPAVSLAVVIRGKATIYEMIPYFVAQFVGGLLAIAVVWYLKGTPQTTPLEIQSMPTFIIEVIYTFLLCFVVLNVATAKGTAGNSTYGLAIGFTVLAGAYAAGPISGGAFNPAVTLALCFVNVLPLSKFWVYLLAQLSGGMLAALIFKVTAREE